jgi:menaquinone-dependent protoporphyrinogen oxidase
MLAGAERRRTMPERRVLVTYSSKYGATAGIAERIGEGLRKSGLRVDVLSVDRVADLAPYDAVVLGSGVYMGNWRKDAATFLTANESALASRPVWLFSDGPTGEGEPTDLMNGWRFPQALQPVADRIHARDIAFFHGALDAKRLSFADKLVVRAVKAPLGDYRDWERIEAWAAEIAAALASESAHAP